MSDIDPAQDDDWTLHPAAARLLGIHALLRRDLARLRAAVLDLGDGRDSLASARDAVSRLAVPMTTRDFRERCLQFCEFLHGHHYVEDQVFPQLSALDAELDVVVQRLIAEHRDVARLIATLRRQLAASHPDVDVVRTTLADLSDHLNEHLAYEEKHIGPALAKLS